MRKRLCVLQVTPSEPNVDHVSFFANKRDCDFFFVTHDASHKDALDFCPNTTWTDTRNILAEKVPKKYDYYAFVDYDYEFVPLGNKNPLGQILEDLDEKEPAVLTYYPGPVGLHTPYAKDLEYRSSKNYSNIPFTHCGLKIVHSSLMGWFFPMVTKFGGGFSACHFFNIQELPFLKNVVTSHKMLYNNGVSSFNSEHNRDQANQSLNMGKVWMWIRPFFNKRFFVDEYERIVKLGWSEIKVPNRLEEYTSYSNPLTIKECYVDMGRKRDSSPKKVEKGIDYFDRARIENFFDIEHEFLRTKFDIKGRENDILVVVGNGPSLKSEYFDLIKENNVDSFALNSSYRYFEEMNWYPTYFGCFDYALCESHNDAWGRMILDDDIPIKKYFFIDRPSNESNLNHSNFFFSKEVRKSSKYVGRVHNQDGLAHPHYGTRNKKLSCTGVNAIRTGIEMGYKKIILIGHDASYIQSEDLDEAEFVQGCRYKVEKDFDHNPNYFWKDYQRKGDLFHKPGNVLPVWTRFGDLVRRYAPDVDVVNCSKKSKIDCFRFSDFEKEILRNKQ